MNPNKEAAEIAKGAAIGKAVDVLEARARVDGTINFALNSEVPNMTYARLLRSPVPHARILSVDTSAAEKMPGVIAILTADDFERPHAPAHYHGPVLRDQPVVCGDKVRFAGDPVAAVAAESLEAADAALLEIEVEYEELPFVTSAAEAMTPEAPLVHDRPPLARDRSYADIKLFGREGNVCTKFQLRHGDVEQGFEEADVVVEGIYESPAVQHVTMEPHVVIASFEGKKINIITSSQSPYAVRDAMAEMFRVPNSWVRVVVPPIGGGFGAKTYAKFEPVTAALAWKARRPVKLVLTREEEFVSITKHAAQIKMRTGASADGRLIARDVEVIFNGGAYADISPRLIKNGGLSCVGPYRIPHVRVDSYAVYTNLPPAGAYRGYGVSQAAWAYEQQMDELADKLQIDPVELRRRNLITQGESFATGEVMDEAHWLELLEKSAVAIDWSGRRRRTVVDESRVKGKGVAVILKSTITPSTTHAGVRLDADGTLQVLTSAVEMGQGAHTVLAQIACDPLGIPVSNVNVTAPDTQYTPYDQTTSSSRTTRAMGGAVTYASREVRAKLLKLAGELLEVAEADLVLEAGHVVAKGAPGTRISIQDVFWRTRTGSISGDGQVITEGGLDPETGQGIASDHWHQGAAGVEVEVDLGTGKVYVKHVHVVAHAGRVVNPKLAKLQMHGNVFFGMSHALYEELEYGDGIPTNPNLSEYSITAMADMPEKLEVELLEDPAEGHIHGIGETVMPAVIAAIGNAVKAATGGRVRSLPITAERVLAAKES